MATPTEVTSMAVFCDFENIALGVRDAHYDKFDIKKVLERLLLKGSIVVKKAYCDWERYKAFKASMHEANFELIEIPHVRQSGKNSADIRMVVDALDLCYTKEHVDTFVIVSGDSDFSPLVSKLRENAKLVIGVGVKNSTSDLLIANCDEFIYYDDLVREQRKGRRSAAAKEPARDVGKPTKGAANGGGKDGAKDVAKAAAKATPKDAAKDAAEGAADALPAAAGKPVKAAAKARGRATAASRTREPGSAGAASGASDAASDSTGTAAAAVSEAAVSATPAGAIHAETAGAATDAERRQAGIAIVVDTLEALAAERGSDRIFGSMIKQAIKRARPQFSESFHGFRSFNAMLEAAQATGALDLSRDEKSGGYVVRLHGADG